MALIERMLFDGSQDSLSVSLSGKVIARSKERGLTRKLSRRESAWFNQVVAIAGSMGVPIRPGVPALDEFFEDYAGSVLIGGGSYLSLVSLSPEQCAGAIADDYLKDQSVPS